MRDIVMAVLADEEYQRTRARLERVRENRAEALAFYAATDERVYRLKAAHLARQEIRLSDRLSSIARAINLRLQGRHLN